MRFSVAVVIALFFSPFVLALPVKESPSTPPPPSDKGKGKEKAENLTPTPESTGGQSEHSSSSGGLDLGRGHPDVGKVKLFPLASYVSALHGSKPNLMQCLQEKARPDGTPFTRDDRRVKHPAVVVGTKKSTEGSEDPTLRIAPMGHREDIVGKVPSQKYVTGPDEGSRIDTKTPKDALSSAAFAHKKGGDEWNVHGFEQLRHDVKQNHKMGQPQRSNTIAVQPHGGGQTDEGQHDHGGLPIRQPGSDGPHPGQVTRHNTIGVPPTTEQAPGSNRGSGSRGQPSTTGSRGGRGRGRGRGRGGSNPPSRGGSPTRGGSRAGSPTRGGSRGGSPARGNPQNRGGNNRGRGRGGRGGRGRGGNNPTAES